MSGLVDPKVRRLVAERDGYLCVNCSRVAVDIQHRCARGMGGTDDPAVNSPVNLLLLCRHCHRAAESRDIAMHGRGMWLNSWENPAEVPVYLFDGRIVLLTSAGGYTELHITRPLD